MNYEKFAEREIMRLRKEAPSYKNCEMLSWLYAVLHGGQDMPESEDHDACLDLSTAEKWVAGMENEDGSMGQHWTLGQVKQLMERKGIPGDPVAYWVALNMVYSDYCHVAVSFHVDTAEFYLCMAEAFLHDKDAVGGGGREKLARYYENVVQH